MSDSDVIRDGFAYSYGMFYARPGRVERVEGSSLRSMFLPRLTREGRRKIDAAHSDYFVRGQLKHYGVQFDESEIHGDGFLLMQKVLQAGKCDRVPDHITELREQMHTEWINKLPLERLSSFPKWLMERYFLSSGQPDHTKTTTVIGVRLDRFDLYRSSEIHEAANKVAGLHQVTGTGPRTQTIFMGWDSVAVSKAAEGYGAKEAKELQDAEDKRENERVKLHTDYLNSLKQSAKGPKTYSPVGSYVINCKEIEEQWPDDAENLSLDIRQTKEPGVFEASFDFGVLKGIMVISAEKSALKQYCSQLDRDAMSDWDEEDEDQDGEEDEDEDEDDDDVRNDRKPTPGSKRKAEAPRGQGRLPKKSKTGATQPYTYLLRFKCRETGEGELQPTQEGTITFKDENLASFIGKADLPCVGDDEPFTGRKISNEPARPRNSWDDYTY